MVAVVTSFASEEDCGDHCPDSSAAAANLTLAGEAGSLAPSGRFSGFCSDENHLCRCRLPSRLHQLSVAAVAAA